MEENETATVDTGRGAWTVPSRVSKYKGLQGWIDDGERLALNSIADEVRGQPVLDIGVGAGRTTWLVRLLTDDYIAVDYSPGMVEACRAAYPGIDVRQGDARDLSEFPSSRFKLVLFSYNGLDNLDRAGRLSVYDEVRRVLRPDGIFAYSTLFKSSPIHSFSSPGPRASPVRRLTQILRDAPVRLVKRPRLYAQWWKSYRAAQDHGEWGLAPAAPVDFNLLHFTSVQGERSILAKHGFAVSDIFADTGEHLPGAVGGFTWFFVVARPA